MSVISVPKSSKLPIGLFHDLKKYLKVSKISFTVDPELEKFGKQISTKKINEFNSKILKLKLTPRDYQIIALQLSLKLKRCIILSSTASGKSLIIYMFFNILKFLNSDFKFLLIVPNISLVDQMRGTGMPLIFVRDAHSQKTN